MTLLVISPDYASHLLPLATLATAWRDAGERVVVASGLATAAITADFGFERAGLSLGRGSNPGVIRAENQVAGEDLALRGFFAATERGMVDTLMYQAEARRADLLWDPIDDRAPGAGGRARGPAGPDHRRPPGLHRAARAAGRADPACRRRSRASQCTSRRRRGLWLPTCLAGGLRAGSGTSWHALLERCRKVRDDFTDEWNAALEVLAPQAVPSTDAFMEHADPVLLNYPVQLHDPMRTARLGPHAFLGSSVRSQQLPPDLARWCDADPGTPLVYVSFGSFLSVRADVLAKVVDALRPLPVRVALAIGSADPAVVGDVPSSWLVREFLPQVALLERAALAVTHGGNNSVTESLTCGVPMLVLPFSTDQFAGAAAVEDAGVGEVLDPNAATVAELRSTVTAILQGNHADLAGELGVSLRAHPGRVVAMEALALATAGRSSG